jgi:hypothetical protein
MLPECVREHREQWSVGRPGCGRGRLSLLGVFATAVVLQLATGSTPAQGAFPQEATAPHWIWHPSATGIATQSFPAETCYFRKSFRVKEQSRLVLDVTADNAFSLFLDGKLVAEGNDWATAQHVEARLAIGPHVLAARASNEAPPIDPASPVNVAYEGELLPHYNDSRGHAAGIMAPGGEIYRSDDDGQTWRRVVAGFRNQYDFAFNQDGELFTFDSDMEWDVGLPWYRPVRVNHCQLGAEDRKSVV